MRAAMNLRCQHTVRWAGGLQVSCFGSNEQSDDGDVWKVTWESSGSSWLQDMKVIMSYLPAANASQL